MAATELYTPQGAEMVSGMISVISVTARVKISKNVDILAKVYRVHFKHCQTSGVVNTFTAQYESTVFDWY